MEFPATLVIIVNLTIAYPQENVQSPPTIRRLELRTYHHAYLARLDTGATQQVFLIIRKLPAHPLIFALLEQPFPLDVLVGLIVILRVQEVKAIAIFAKVANFVQLGQPLASHAPQGHTVNQDLTQHRCVCLDIIVPTAHLTHFHAMDPTIAQGTVLYLNLVLLVFSVLRRQTRTHQRTLCRAL